MSRLFLSAVALFLLGSSAVAQEGEPPAPAHARDHPGLTRCGPPVREGTDISLLLVLFAFVAMVIFLYWVVRSSPPAPSVARPPFWEDEELDDNEPAELPDPPWLSRKSKPV